MRHDQHDAAFKGILEHILSSKCVRTISGAEVAKFPLRVDLITERICPVSPDLGLIARLLNLLPPIVIHEFKGPTDRLQEKHIWRLIAYSVLFAMERKISFFEMGLAAIVIYVKTSNSIRAMIDAQSSQIIQGVRRYAKIDKNGFIQIIFIDVNELEISIDNLPFLIFRERDLDQVLDLIRANPNAKRLYGYELYKIQRKKLQKILQSKGINLTEVATLKEMIEDFGIKAVIDEVGIKAVIDEVGIKAVIDEVGIDAIVEKFNEAIESGGLSSEEEEHLKKAIVEMAKRLGLKITRE